MRDHTFALASAKQLIDDKVINQCNAQCYAMTTEKYMFVTDLLDGLDLPRSDYLINYIEDQFDDLLEGWDVDDLED